MIGFLDSEGLAALPALYARGASVPDQWKWIVDRAVLRTGVGAVTIEAELHAQGYLPTSIVLADDEVCAALVDGLVRRMDAVEAPHNHVAVEDRASDTAAKIVERIERFQDAATWRDRTLAEICMVHDVDAFVASRALAALGPAARDGGPTAAHGARLFIASPSYTEH